VTADRRGGGSRRGGGEEPGEPSRRTALDARHAEVYAGAIPDFDLWPAGPRLLAGRNPLSERDVSDLVERGVTHVLDLREESEWTVPGRVGSDAVAALARRGIERRHVPIGDFQAPTSDDLSAAADWLDEVHARPETTLYVHCRAGLQRTATVLAARAARRAGISYAAAERLLAAAGYPGGALRHQRAAAEAWLETQVVPPRPAS